MSNAKQVLEEEYHRNIARQRVIHQAREALRAGDLSEAVINILRVVEMLSASEERVMRLHAECHAMVEHAGKILELDATLRPVIIQLPSDSPGTQEKT
jgi:hypothetical protein